MENKDEFLSEVRSAASDGVSEYLGSDVFSNKVRGLAGHTATEAATAAVHTSINEIAKRFGIDLESDGKEGKDGMLAPSEVKSMLFWGRGVKNRCTDINNKIIFMVVGAITTVMLSAIGFGIVKLIVDKAG